MADADGFFSRWSQRKVALARGQPVADPTTATPPATAWHTAPPTGPAATSGAAPQSLSELRPGTAGAGDVAAIPGAPGVLATSAGSAASPEATPVPLPTLEDAQALTPASDFKPFMVRGVAPEVKNAAMKKLFADPHYNVMDRLDIYIDDYSQPDPLPLAMLRKMTSAKFLNLFDEDPDSKAPAVGDVADVQGEANLPQSAPEAARVERTAVTEQGIAEPVNPPMTGEPAAFISAPESPPQPPPHLTPLTPLTEPNEPTDHAHADLRLQPHHAAFGARPGRGGERDPEPAQQPVPS